jgi:23S rRNA pseudoU1915 N3-methylase RlmH
VWGRTINHRPRKDRGNLSRVEIASQTPTPEEVELAKKNLQERKRRQDKARETTQARRDPELASLIRKEFDQLCLEDPGDHFLDALTRYSKDVVVNALAIFKAKKKNDESKKDIDARYLLGIANNIDNERYLSTLASELWQLREKAADEMSQYLQNEKKELELLFPNPDDFARNAMNKAVENDQFFRMRFWVEAVVEKVKNQNSPQATFQNLARSLAGNFKATKNGRERALRLLAEKLLPL